MIATVLTETANRPRMLWSIIGRRQIQSLDMLANGRHCTDRYGREYFNRQSSVWKFNYNCCC